MTSFTLSVVKMELAEVALGAGVLITSVWFHTGVMERDEPMIEVAVVAGDGVVVDNVTDARSFSFTSPLIVKASDCVCGASSSRLFKIEAVTQFGNAVVAATCD